LIYKKKERENMKRFTTDMGSLAYQNIYDLLELQENLKYSPDTSLKDMPISVRENHDKLIDSLIESSDIIDDQIINWIVSTIIQSRNLDDVHYMDELLSNQLTDMGSIDKAVNVVRNTPGTPKV